LTLQQVERFTTVDDGENPMTLPQSGTTERPLGRDLAYAARYYLRTRWTLVALASLAVVLGLYFGGWAWLVAAGLAPILLSTLPCLVMCGLGVCMMCRGQKQPVASRDAVDTPTSSALDGPRTNSSSVRAASCCHDGAVDAQPAQLNTDRSEERNSSHA
jgi:hypothetical protein